MHCTHYALSHCRYNGSFFATVYALFNFSRILTQATHHPLRKIALLLQFVFNVYQTLLTWVLPALFFMQVLQRLFLFFFLSFFLTVFLSSPLALPLSTALISYSTALSPFSSCRWTQS
jgi:hypothetical protein